MLYRIALLALAVCVKSKPVAVPQGVTEAVSPIDPPPAGCIGSFNGAFGIAVNTISSQQVAKRYETATQISE